MRRVAGALHGSISIAFLAFMIILWLHPRVSSEDLPSYDSVKTVTDSTASSISSSAPRDDSQDFLYRHTVTLYRDMIDAHRFQLNMVLLFSALFVTLLSILIVVFGYIKPEKERQQFESNLTSKFADLERELRAGLKEVEETNRKVVQEIETAKVSSEDLSFAFTNLLFGNMLMDKNDLSANTTAQLPGGTEPLPYFVNALHFLTLVKVRYSRLGAAYAFILHGMHVCLLAGRQLTAADSVLTENALRYLETDPVWRQDGQVAHNVMLVRQRISPVTIAGADRAGDGDSPANQSRS